MTRNTDTGKPLRNRLQKDMANSPRQLVLVSHANPEDNQATIWFASQLANEGYRVWSDVLSLGGGEDFWGDIEDVIRQHAAKVVFLLSPAANRKDGCLKELNLAQTIARRENLKDFVIPLRIGDIPHADVNIRINSVNIVDALAWNVGLAALLKKLEDDGVPRERAKDFRATSAWWQSRFATSLSVRDEPEILVSNWFRVCNPTLQLYWHRIARSEIGPVTAPPDLRWPSFDDSGGIWTFMPANVVAQQLRPPYRVERTVEKQVGTGIETGKTERNTAYRLLNLAWQSRLEKIGLIRHALANDKYCFAFPDGLIEGNEIGFQTSSGRKGHRGVAGYKTRINAKGESWLRHWHFAIQPIPAFSPQLMLMVRTHVLFSEDGKNLWTSATRLQKARRNQCVNWWNDAWRDRVLAVMSWLANGQETIALDVGSPEPITIEREPMEFASPVSYLTPTKPLADADETGTPESSDLDADDEDDDFEADQELADEEI